MCVYMSVVCVCVPLSLCLHVLHSIIPPPTHMIIHVLLPVSLAVVFPDIETCDVTDDLEFVLMACDGEWLKWRDL